ncbi:hypothetical protein Ancab_021720 [Ancistrocladus abbreviatus]
MWNFLTQLGIGGGVDRESIEHRLEEMEARDASLYANALPEQNVVLVEEVTRLNLRGCVFSLWCNREDGLWLRWRIQSSFWGLCLGGRWGGSVFQLPVDLSWLGVWAVEGAASRPVKMEAQEGNSSDIRRPETEVGSANASNTSKFIEDFNDVPSNQGDFDHSAIDPSVCPSKKARSKVWDH